LRSSDAGGRCLIKSFPEKKESYWGEISLRKEMSGTLIASGSREEKGFLKRKGPTKGRAGVF